jgi:hypothetical protein
MTLFPAPGPPVRTILVIAGIMRNVPRIIDYVEMTRTLEAEGYACNYPNSGSFSLRGGNGIIRGWLTTKDESVLPDLPTRIVGGRDLAEMAVAAWRQYMPGNALLAPSSHWAFEMQFGHPQELKPILQGMGLDEKAISEDANGSAIEFQPAESGVLQNAVSGLLSFLLTSDFMLYFPGYRTSCMIHHHKQLWWVSANEAAVGGLDKIGAG